MELAKVKQFLSQYDHFLCLNYKEDWNFNPKVTEEVLTKARIDIFTDFDNVLFDIEGIIYGETNAQQLQSLLDQLNQEDEVEFEGETYDSLYKLTQDMFGTMDGFVQFSEEDGNQVPYVFQPTDETYAYNHDKIVPIRASDLDYHLYVIESWTFNLPNYYHPDDTSLYGLKETTTPGLYEAIDIEGEVAWRLQYNPKTNIFKLEDEDEEVLCGTIL